MGHVPSCWTVETLPTLGGKHEKISVSGKNLFAP